ncbi:MAG: type II secretion system F family protein, partial [Bdellovibrionales bacterium]|nr:type II secretion system F family protein [Bdellovibrionales bacterium]
MIHPSIWISLLILGAIISVIAYQAYPIFEQKLLDQGKGQVAIFVDLSKRMFMEVSVKRALILILVSSFTFASLGFYMTYGLGLVNGLFTLFFGLFGFLLPTITMKFLWTRRLSAFNEQLIDALNLLSNSLKSGLNLSQAIQVLVREMPNPISQEFGVVLSQEKVGLTMDDALEKLSERVSSEDLSVVIQSILILRETGGNLSETFDVIANTIRERRRVDGKIQSMTAQGKLQGLIL